MDFIQGLLVVFLVSAATVSALTMFGLFISVVQAMSAWFMFMLAVHIIKKLLMGYSDSHTKSGNEGM